MTASFSDLITIANDSGFRGRCFYALEVAAINIMSEDSGTASHAQRVAYAITVLNGSASIFQVSVAILTNSAIAGEADVTTLPGCTSVPDGDIQFAVNSLFNALAGVVT